VEFQLKTRERYPRACLSADLLGLLNHPAREVDDIRIAAETRLPPEHHSLLQCLAGDLVQPDPSCGVGGYGDSPCLQSPGHAPPVPAPAGRVCGQGHRLLRRRVARAAPARGPVEADRQHCEQAAPEPELPCFNADDRALGYDGPGGELPCR
jgi:hypothetical protein